MKVDIWSDVRCPFCYIGKRKFEIALEQFAYRDEVKVEWHSFELDPDTETSPDLNVYDYLAQKKGKTRAWAEEMHNYVVDTAAQVGLRFNFDHAVIANSFHAHRLIQLAKSVGLDNTAEELLFKAYFTDGKNIDDKTVLKQIGVSAGLDASVVTETLDGYFFGNEVRADEQIASQIGITGVPFFIFDQKLTVSGAQAPETFLGAMEQLWGDE